MSLRRFVLAAVLALTGIGTAMSARAANGPRVGDEHIVLHTIGGDIVLALYPDVAPETCKQLIALVKLGVYDTTHFHRCEPNFVLQLSTPDYRLVPMTDEQKKAIHPIKAEFSNIPHKRGVVSMARLDKDVNSAETSFSILLGDAPHLDHEYTIFGRVESGMDVVDGLVKVPRKKDPIDPKKETTEPSVMLLIGHAEVADTATLATLKLNGPQPILNDSGIAAESPSRRLVLSGLALVVVLGLIGFLLASKVSQRTLLFVNVMNILIGGLLLFLLLTEAGRSMLQLDADPAEALGEAALAGLLGMAGVIVVALLGVILTRATPKMVSSLNLINVLIGGFLLFAMVMPSTQTNSTLAGGVFLAIVSVFKLMGHFEST